MDLMELNDLAAPGTTFSGCGDAVRAILESATDVERVASDTLTPRMLALIELAVALAIPNREMASACLRRARAVASHDDVAETVLAACALKAGAATAYGRLVFKFLDPGGQQEDAGDDRTQIQKDRALMTQFRAGSIEGFAAFQRRATASSRKALTEKEHELICVACASITHCIYCLEKHGSAARKAGATDREVADTLHLVISARTTATLFEWQAADASVRD